MPAIRIVLLAAAFLALAGCFQSEQEFVKASDADFPFETITYRSDDDDEEYTLKRSGSDYVTEDEDDTRVRLKKLGDGMWLAQTAYVEEGKTNYLFGVVVLSADGKGFQIYKAIAEEVDRAEAVLSKYKMKRCADDEDNVCLAAADGYIAYVKDRIAAGETPSNTFVILKKK